MFEFAVLLFTFWQRNAVTLAVQQAANLGELAIPLHVVLNGGALHEEGVRAVLLDHAVEALLVASFGVDARLGRLHERIELLVCRDCRTLVAEKYWLNALLTSLEIFIRFRRAENTVHVQGFSRSSIFRLHDPTSGRNFEVKLLLSPV